MLLEKWMSDPVGCCEAIGLQTPMSALRSLHNDFGTAGRSLTATLDDLDEYLEAPPTSPYRGQNSRLGAAAASSMSAASADVCAICLDEDVGDGDLCDCVPMPCQHTFCRRCWCTYLTMKITEGDADHVTCPALGCCMLVPVDLIENMVSKETARKYLQFDLNSFVATNRSIKWCPNPGCGRAVRLPETEQMQPQIMTSSLAAAVVKCPARTSHAVDCGNGHFFCWEVFY